MRMKNNRGEVNTLRSADSAATTPQSSAYPSAYPSEDEGDTKQKSGSFPFLGLPSELRNKIYDMVFSAAPAILDLDPFIFKLFHRTQMLAIFRVSKLLHEETTHRFFSTHILRLFPTFPGKYFKTKRPLLSRVPAHYRESITSLELRLGPGWNNPPRGWVVNDALGLADCKNVRVLQVFVECDPSDAIYEGFRKFEGFYEGFCATLLDETLKRTSSVKVVEFDGYSAVKRNGAMMSGLAKVVSSHGKIVAWDSSRNGSTWAEDSDPTWLDAVLIHATQQLSLSKNVAVLA